MRGGTWGPKFRVHHTEALEAGNVVQVVDGAAADTVLVVEVQVESAATIISDRKIDLS